MLKEGSLNKVPEMYESLSGSPIRTITKAGDTYKSIIRLKKFVDHTVTVPAAGGGIAGGVTIEGDHNIKEGQVFAYVYTPLIQTLVAINPLRYDDTSYRADILNLNVTPRTVTVRLYFYQLMQKTRS